MSGTRIACRTRLTQNDVFQYRGKHEHEDYYINTVAEYKVEIVGNAR